jgi:hypothetical protein
VSVVAVVIALAVVAMIFAPKRERSPDEIMVCPCPRCGYDGAGEQPAAIDPDEEITKPEGHRLEVDN